MLNILINLLTFGKIVQHLITAFLFLVNIQGVGKPDVGPFFQFSEMPIALLNLILVGLFLIGFFGKVVKKSWALFFILELAAIDIVMEVLFHGLFFLTMSTLVSMILIGVILLYEKTLHGRIILR
jgi:hypothetical protein